jgi:hypothetical protein
MGRFEGGVVLPKIFDLNIEDVLENWEPYHAIREVIANSLDEQLISDTADIEISEGEDGWHIRDFGRGIQIEHFTMNENPEKLDSKDGVIGKFGVGLKDALATFNRNGISPNIRSAHGTYTVAAHCKHGFEDISTLHVEYDDTPNDMDGTDVYLVGATEFQVSDAKDLFLKFSDTGVVEDTNFGSVLEPVNSGSNRVYINGVLANEEENFLYSYNITKLTKQMRKALNRERTNVGRATYTERIKAILKAVDSEEVKRSLSEQVKMRGSGEQCDEVGWVEVAQVAIQALANLEDDVVYVTEEEMLNNPDEMARMRMEGRSIISVSSKDRDRIPEGSATTFVDYVVAFNESFEFNYVEEDELTTSEKEIFGKTGEIIGLVGWSEGDFPKVLISETMQPETGRDLGTGITVVIEAVGLWQPGISTITIKRSQLSSLHTYAATLLHEAAHASSGATDATRRFESELTQYLGSCADEAIENSD